MKQAIAIVVSLVGIVLIPSLANSQSKIDKLTGWILVQPKDSFVVVQITYRYVNENRVKERLQFYLDKHFQVTQLRCPKMKGFNLKSDISSPLADFMNTFRSN